mgnify:CR=1 FL=1|jgi:hypothetical protein
MRKILIILIVITGATAAYADYSKNPYCRGYGILEQTERQKCLEANGVVSKPMMTGNGVDTKQLKDKTGKFFKKLGLNTDSKLLKTGKYSESK